MKPAQLSCLFFCLLAAYMIPGLASAQEPSTEEAASQAPLAPPADPAMVSGYGVVSDDLLLQARQRAIRLAAAFANEGYKLRDGAWSFNLTPAEPRTLAVFLFAGNEVWFSAAGATTESRPQLAVFDSEGAPLQAKTYHADGLAALGFVVPRTGMFYLQASTSTEATPFALVTSYK